MAKGFSLHVGINRVSGGAFEARPLTGCENDATAMRDIARSQGFADIKVLLSEDATFGKVDAEVRRAAAALEPGDLFLFTFAGHGSRIPDEDDEELRLGETDGQDEALVLFDRLMLDDYLRRVLWPQFKAGVRIVAVLDSCHSATVAFKNTASAFGPAGHNAFTATGGDTGVVTSGAGVVEAVRADSAAELATISSGPPLAAESLSYAAPVRPESGGEEFDVVEDVRPGKRALDDSARKMHGEEFRTFYEELEIPSTADAPPLKAGLLTLAACEDGAKTRDGRDNGAFTEALLKVWDNGEFQGSYSTLKEAITVEVRNSISDQTPALNTENRPGFGDERPFTI